MHDEITARIQEALPGSRVEVQVEGNRALIKVVSGTFADMTRVQRHQAVYSCVNELIASGTLHAVSISTETG